MNTESTTSKNIAFSLERIIRSSVLWVGYGVVCGLPCGLMVAYAALMQDGYFRKSIWVDGTREDFLIGVTFSFAISFGLAMLLGRVMFFRLDDGFLHRNYLWISTVVAVGTGAVFLLGKSFVVFFSPIVVLLAIPVLHYWKCPEKEKPVFRATLDKLVKTFAVWLGHGAVFGWLLGVLVTVIVFGIENSDVVYGAVFKETKYSKDVHAFGVIAFLFGAPLGIIALLFARMIFFRLSDEFLHANRWWFAVITIIGVVALGIFYIYREMNEIMLMLGTIGVFLCAIAVFWLIQCFFRKCAK